MDKLKVEGSNKPVPREQTLEKTESRAEKSVVSMKQHKKGNPEFFRTGDSGLRTDKHGQKIDDRDLKKDKFDVRKDSYDLGEDNSDLRKDNSCPSTMNPDEAEHTLCAMDRGSERKVIPPWTERFRPAQNSPPVKDSHLPPRASTLVGKTINLPGKDNLPPRRDRLSPEKYSLSREKDNLVFGKDCPRTGEGGLLGKDRPSPARVTPLHHNDISLPGTKKPPSGEDLSLTETGRSAVETDNSSAKDNPTEGNPSTGKILPGKDSPLLGQDTNIKISSSPACSSPSGKDNLLPGKDNKSPSGKDKPQQTVVPVRQGVELSFLKDLKMKHKFSLAFDHQNQVAATAIKSLDSLNDQIVQYIFGQSLSAGPDHHGDACADLDLDPLSQGREGCVVAPPGSNTNVTSAANNSNNTNGSRSGGGLGHVPADNLHSSMVLIRKLLQDAQSKFRKMVEENKQLAVKIDGSIQSANHEVNALRAELADTNKRLSQINTPPPSPGAAASTSPGVTSHGVGNGDGACVITNARGADTYKASVKTNVDVADTDRDSLKVSSDSSKASTDSTNANSAGASTDVVGMKVAVEGAKSGGGSFSNGGGGGGEICGAMKNGEEKMDSNKDVGDRCKSTRTEQADCKSRSLQTEMTDSKSARADVDSVDCIKSARADVDTGDCKSKKECKSMHIETDIDAVCNKARTQKCENEISACRQSQDELPHESKEMLISRLREEKSQLEARVRSLTREVEELRCGHLTGGDHTGFGEMKLELIQARQELNRAKEALQAMKSDRKRLKTEKVELLHQMKQLYVTLEDKESELRDFIRNYEQRVQESDESIKQLAMEKEESEREKWEIIKKARESAERAVVLRTQLDAKDLTIAELQDEIAKLKEQQENQRLDESRDSNNPTPTPADNDNGHDIENASATTATTANTSADGATGSETESCHTPESNLSKDSFSGMALSTPASDTVNDSLSSLMKWMASSSEMVDGDSTKNMKKKRKSFGSLSKVFSRGRSRRSIALPHNENLLEDGSGMKLFLLTPDNYQEKLQTIQGMKDVHMCQWRAGQVLAWLEITLGMPMYGRNCALNIKSGKVLLGLSDSELGTALGIGNHIHRRKLRLAIEAYRDPATIKYALAPSMDVTWVAHKLLPDIGLPQYSHVFERHLVDGRILHSLSRRDLEKHFDIHRKFHQASILHAVELLQRLDFDREKLSQRRSQCEDSDSDLLVWTCGRVIKWTKSIDLGEFADNLRESGVHGALMVLEPSFTSDTLATALAIPPSKSYIRRHLATELDTLLRPARAALDTPNNNSKHLDSSSKGHTFTRSYRGQHTDDSSKGRLSFRGSLGRAFGKKIRDDLKLAFDSGDSPKWKISAPIPIQHTSLDNVVEIPGDSMAV